MSNSIETDSNDSCDDSYDDSYDDSCEDLLGDSFESQNDKSDENDNTALCIKCKINEPMPNSKYCIKCIKFECSICKDEKVEADVFCNLCTKKCIHIIKTFSSDIYYSSNVNIIEDDDIIECVTHFLEFNKYANILGKTAYNICIELTNNKQNVKTYLGKLQELANNGILTKTNNKKLNDLLLRFINNSVSEVNTTMFDNINNIIETLLTIFSGKIKIESPNSDKRKNNFNIFDHQKDNFVPKKKYSDVVQPFDMGNFDDSDDDMPSNKLGKSPEYPQFNKNNFFRKNNNAVQLLYRPTPEKLNYPPPEFTNNNIIDDETCSIYIAREISMLPNMVHSDYHLENILSKSIKIIEYFLTKPIYLTQEGINIFNDILSEKNKLCDVYRKLFFEILSQTNIEIFNGEYKTLKLVNIATFYFDGLFSLLSF